MILQTAGHKAPFVISQNEHALLASAFARAMGNSEIRPLAPEKLMSFIVENHDRGWDGPDNELAFNTKTGLPYDLLETPIEELIKIGPVSVDFCESYHPYCGLIVSMHVYGLWTGRYGLSDVAQVNLIPDEIEPELKRMLNNELARQERLRRLLGVKKELGPWLSEERLFYNYRRLQFVDTLALYFNSVADNERQDTKILKVPLTFDKDEDIEVSRLKAHTYSFLPFPFRDSGMTVTLRRMGLSPQPDGTTFSDMKGQYKSFEETITLIERA